jgi:hypothetical protein
MGCGHTEREAEPAIAAFWISRTLVGTGVGESLRNIDGPPNRANTGEDFGVVVRTIEPR